MKNGLNSAILGKRDKSDQSWTVKRDSKKVLLKFLLTPAKNPQSIYCIARHYLFHHFSSPFLFFKGSFFGKFCPYVWLVFKSGLRSRAGYDGAVQYIVCTVVIR